MNAHLLIEELVNELRVKTRAKLHEEANISDWATWFAVPLKDYVEASSYGPCHVREVEWIEIDPVVETRIGRLVKPQMIDHSAQIQESLEVNTTQFERWNHVFRVALF